MIDLTSSKMSELLIESAKRFSMTRTIIIQLTTEGCHLPTAVQFMDSLTKLGLFTNSSIHCAICFRLDHYKKLVIISNIHTYNFRPDSLFHMKLVHNHQWSHLT